MPAYAGTGSIFKTMVLVALAKYRELNRMNLQMAITLAVLLISIALYIWGKIPYLAISLAAPIVLFFCGIVTADEIFGHLTNKGLLMSIGMFVCGGALINSGAAETFGYFVTKRLKSERK